jgi:hypothetical protein
MKIKSFFKWLIRIILGGGIAYAGTVGTLEGIDVMQQQAKTDAIGRLPNELKLKANEIDILQAREADDVRCDDKANCTKVGRMKSYAYISTTTVPQETLPTVSMKLDKKIDRPKEDMDKRTSNAQFFKVGEDKGNDVMVAKFYSGDTFVKKDNEWRVIEYATTTPEAFDLQTSVGTQLILEMKRVYADTFTSGAGDGDVTNSGTNYTTVRDAGTGNGANYTGVTLEGGDARRDATNFYFSRNFLPFNTAAIGSGKTMVSGTIDLKIFTRNDFDAHGTSQYALVSNTSASDTTLSTADFDAVGSTELATRLTGIKNTNSSYVSRTFTLNASGLANINGSGYSKFAVREGNWDLDGNNIMDTSTQPYSYIHMSENTTAENRPLLTVTYTSGSVARRRIIEVN